MGGVSLRATYIIDDLGVLRHSSVTDIPVGRDIDEVIRLVQAFQHSDKYGEVCPASWTPGAPVMDADPESNKTVDYWKDVHAVTVEKVELD